MRYTLLSLLLLFIITSCASMNHMNRTEVEVEHDDFSTLTTYRGVYEQVDNGNFITSDRARYFLRSFVDKEDATRDHQLYVISQYDGDWRFYNRASFAGGTAAEFTELSRDVNDCSGAIGCNLTEQYTIDLPESYLIENKNGFDVKVYSQAGYDVVLTVTSEQIIKQFNAMNVAI